MPAASDQTYLTIATRALEVCAAYKPRFGQGRDHGLTLAEFRTLYRADPFYNWFGLDSPLMYAAHKAAGGMTSIYRQIGIGCQWIFNRIIQDTLGLTAAQAAWSYTVPASVAGTTRTLTLDGRISPMEVTEPAARNRVVRWLKGACDTLELPTATRRRLLGAVLEIRQGYKSKDSKRQNADVANASNAYANNYLPVVVLLSSQIDEDIAERYSRARWLMLTGTLGGDEHTSTYAFSRDVLGYDLAAFFQRNSTQLHQAIETVLTALLSPERG